MTPSTLLGGTVTGGSSSSANSSRTSNATGNGDAGKRDGFASMLERPSPKDGGTSRASARNEDAGRAREANGKAKPASREATSRDDANRKDTASATDDAKTTQDDASATDASTASAPAAADAAPQSPAPTATPVDAPWPPPGLAGLALSASVPADAEAALPTAALPAAATTAGNATIATITLPPLTATDATASGTAALATAAAASSAQAAQAGAGDEAATLQVSQLFQQAMADTGGDVDGAVPSPTLLHALGAAPEIRGTAPSPIFTGDPTPVPNMDGEGFDDAIGARVGWLADQKIGHAHIRISPDDMGQIDVRLHLDGDRLHATFQSNQAEVRQALEQSLPRLREMLGEHGFQLGNADVGQQHKGSSDTHAGADAHGMSGGDAGTPGGDVALPAPLIRLNRLLDAYA